MDTTVTFASVRETMDRMKALFRPPDFDCLVMTEPTWQAIKNVSQHRGLPLPGPVIDELNGFPVHVANDATAARLLADMLEREGKRPRLYLEESDG